jgi:hypothetical protein
MCCCGGVWGYTKIMQKQNKNNKIDYTKSAVAGNGCCAGQ